MSFKKVVVFFQIISSLLITRPFGNYISNKEGIKYGVSQGSILGPLLFIIFIDELQITFVMHVLFLVEKDIMN